MSGKDYGEVSQRTLFKEGEGRKDFVTRSKGD